MTSRATSASSARHTASPSQPGGPAKVVKGSRSSGEARYFSTWFSDRSTLMRAGVRPAARPARSRSTVWSSRAPIWRWRSTSARADSGVGALTWGATMNSSAWTPVIWSARSSISRTSMASTAAFSSARSSSRVTRPAVSSPASSTASSAARSSSHLARRRASASTETSSMRSSKRWSPWSVASVGRASRQASQ